MAVGGALGSVARWLASSLAATLVGSTFPWGTLFVNVLGSFVIGLYFTLTDTDGRYLVGPAVRQFVLAGICGGFTTFSSFSLETVLLATNSAWSTALLYVAVSVPAWLLSAWLGHMVGVRLNRLPWRHR